MLLVIRCYLDLVNVLFLCVSAGGGPHVLYVHTDSGLRDKRKSRPDFFFRPESAGFSMYDFKFYVLSLCASLAV